MALCVFSRDARDQRDITGLETAIVLIAFVVISSVFAFAALSTGLLSSDASKATLHSGLEQARGTLSLRGSVIAEDTDVDGKVNKVYFQVTNAAGGGAIDLTPGETVLSYSDSQQSRLFDTSAKFSVTPLGTADNDYLVEPGEMYELALLELEANLVPVLTTRNTFTIEVLTPDGAVLHLERTTPSRLEKFNDLSQTGGGLGSNVATPPTVYVLDDTANTVYKYEDGGVYVGSSALAAANSDARGIASEGTTFWAADAADDKAYKYDSAFASLTSWALYGSNGNSQGVATDGTTIWTVDDGGNEVWYYTMSGTYTDGWLLTSGNDSPRGMTTNGIDLWVVDSGDDKVYRYDLTGRYDSSFSLAAANADAEGITTDGSNVWVVDATDDLVYKYDMSGTFVSSFSLSPANGGSSGIVVLPRAPLATFQDGTNGYTGTVDIRFKEDAPTIAFAVETTVSVDLDASFVNQGLIRFDDLFGSGDGQIPLGSTITSAALSVYVGDSAQSGDQITLHRMLVSWNEESTWASLTNGVQADGVEASSTADATSPNPQQVGTQTFSGLTATLQAWSDGAVNYGWAILTDSTDGWTFSSSENATQSQRPILRVTYK